jgi:hypothetical protein
MGSGVLPVECNFELQSQNFRGRISAWSGLGLSTVSLVVTKVQGVALFIFSVLLITQRRQKRHTNALSNSVTSAKVVLQQLSNEKMGFLQDHQTR